MRFQVQVRGTGFVVIDSRTGLIAAGPFADRVRAQAAADELERRS